MAGIYQNGFPIGYNTNNLYNPQVTQFTNPQTPQQNNTSIIWVQGEAGAKSYMMAPNTTLSLWDSEDQKIYLKTTDQNGVPSMKTLKYEIVEPVKLEDKYLTRQEFTSYMDGKISAIISELKGALYGKSDISRNEPTTAESRDNESV